MKFPVDVTEKVFLIVAIAALHCAAADCSLHEEPACDAPPVDAPQDHLLVSSSHQRTSGDDGTSVLQANLQQPCASSSHHHRKHVDISDMSVEQIQQELKIEYDIVMDDADVTLLVQRLEESRCANAVVNKGRVRYGEVVRVGNLVDPTGIVVISHGLGDNGRGWVDVARDLSLHHRHLLFILPRAPSIPLSVNGGQPINAWYDVKVRGALGIGDANILASATYISSLARQAANKYRIPTSRILFSGFSQGGALSLAAGLTASFRPAAILVLSSYFGVWDHVIPMMTNVDVPVLFCHGNHDNILPLKLAEASKVKLTELGFRDVIIRTYPVAHSLHPEELKHVSEFIAKHLPPLMQTHA